MSTPIPGKALLGVQNITHSFGAQPILKEVSLTLHEGDRVGLIGRNGSGKSTLMKILVGSLEPDAGLITRSDGLRVALLLQQCTLNPEATINQCLNEAASELHALVDEYHAVMEKLAHTPGDCWEHQELQEQCDHLSHALEIADAWQVDERIKRVAVSLNLPEAERTIGTLSGGELRRVDLATKLIQQPDVLLLDEPTNHIDTRSVEWIERFLETYTGCCVLVTHDRYFLDRVVNRIVEIEFNNLYTFPGNYERFLDYKANLELQVVRAENNRQALIRRELAWLRRGPKARTGKQKARINRALDVIEQEAPEQHREFVFEIPEPQRLAKTILEARHVGHGYGDTLLFQKLDLIMQKNMRVGILGPNGSGKTTLLRVLMGQEQPRKGQIIIGDTTEFLYVDQNHEDMDPQLSIIKYVSDGAHHIDINRKRMYVPAYLEKFLFDKTAVESPISNLSGGEKNRLDLVKKLLRGGNFLVLDEPTNDLDLYSLRVLEETLDTFDGCALIVSHDRYFLNRVCTHMLIFEDDKTITQITGNYDDYVVYREKQRLAEKDTRAAQSAARSTAKSAIKKKETDSPRRLTWHEKQELETMEEAILEAESTVEAREAALLEPGFYEQDHKVVQEALDDLQQAKNEVARLYARWEDLEALQGR